MCSCRFYFRTRDAIFHKKITGAAAKETFPSSPLSPLDRMMPASEQLFAVVQGISNTQKDVRDGAEAVYEREWVTRPASLFPSLLEVLGNVEDPVVSAY